MTGGFGKILAKNCLWVVIHKEKPNMNGCQSKKFVAALPKMDVKQ